MKTIAAVSLLLLGLLPNLMYAADCPVATPDAGQFYIAAPIACNAAEPCVAAQAIPFSLVKVTTCYPHWAPCPGYTIQACDLVTWSFDDGSAPVVVTGKSTVTHQFSPGRHRMSATVQNAKGTATVFHDLHVGMAPAAFVKSDQSAYTFDESQGVATVRLVRSGETNRTVPVTFEVGSGALVPTRGEVVFAPGEVTKQIALPIVNDTTRHDWGASWVTLYQSGGEAILRDGYVASIPITIIDDDPAAVVTPVLQKRTYVEGNGAPTTVHVGIKLSPPQAESLRLTYSVLDQNGTASWGSDYAGGRGELEIPAGKTEASFDVDLLGDTIAEPTETLVLWLGVSTDNFGASPRFDGFPLTLTITDDDDPRNPVSARMNPGELHLEPGQRADVFFATSAVPAARQVTLSSSNPGVARVQMPDRTLLGNYSALAFTIDALAPGTATVTGTIAGGLSASMVVHVGGPVTAPLPDLYFSPGFLDLDSGATKRLTIQAGNIANEPRVVTLTPSNPSLVALPATVTIPAGANEAGFDVTGRAGGYTTLSARVPDGRSTIVAITVTAPAPPPPPAVTTPVLTLPATVKARVGVTQSIPLTLRPSSQTRVTLKASRNGTVTIPATITLTRDGRGTVSLRGVSAGTVDITATASTVGGKTVTATTKVTVAKASATRND